MGRTNDPLPSRCWTYVFCDWRQPAIALNERATAAQVALLTIRIDLREGLLMTAYAGDIRQVHLASASTMHRRW